MLINLTLFLSDFMELIHIGDNPKRSSVIKFTVQSTRIVHKLNYAFSTWWNRTGIVIHTVKAYPSSFGISLPEHFYLLFVVNHITPHIVIPMSGSSVMSSV